MFKYDLNQMIFYMQNNKIHSAPILGRSTIETIRRCEEDDASAIGKLYNQLGAIGVFYATCHGIIKEADAFNSKEGLADHLLSEADSDTRWSDREEELITPGGELGGDYIKVS